MHKIWKFSLSLIVCGCMSLYSTQSYAQILNEQKEVVTNYDPIAATLDSLVNLTYVQRLNLTASTDASNGIKSFEVPTYSPEVYQKRISKIATPIPLCYNSKVQDYITMYALKKRGLTERVMGLSGLYFPLFEQILDQQGLPVEFKYLSIVESALNPTAVSRVGATGLWQFMHGTGKLYDLKINSYIDERRDPALSTMAACQYFKDMYAIYNDWLLVIAAYNCGPGNVNRAIARSGGKKTFWEIERYLPRETRGYVPAFIAVTYLMTYASEHNLIPVPPTLTYYEIDTVMTDQKVSLQAIADGIDMPVEMVKYLNPIYKRGIIPESETQLPLCLPSNKMNAYIANVDAIYKRDADNSVMQLTSSENFVESQSDELVKKHHKVKSGENLQVIAKKYKCTVSDLKNWNKLRGNSLKAGQNLTVYVFSQKKSDKVVMTKAPAKTSTVASATKKKTQTISSDDSNFVWHTVQPGDSLWKIAQRYEGVTVEKIKELNNLQSNNLKVGTKLKVVVNG